LHIVTLKKGREASLERKHPWVFSGAIKKINGRPKDGEIVQVVNFKREILGVGHYQNGSIMVRVCHFGEGSLDQEFWNNKIKNALAYRKEWIFPNFGETNCYRLIHGEGDGLPGLVIDIYGSTAVVQCHSIGMHIQRKSISKALQASLGETIRHIFSKSQGSLPKNYGEQHEDEFLLGDASNENVKEHGHQFYVDWQLGQKTGFFLDQRENRNLLAKYATGKSVLNTFCYSGGFSVYALKAGASEVLSVDISPKAIDWTNKNVALNPDFIGKHESSAEDVMEFFKTHEKNYDIIVVDPPAFAKSIKKRHQAVQGYKRLNAMALRRVKSGGLLFTYSCSQVVDDKLFYHTIVAAAHEAGKNVRVMQRMSQPADHPVNLYHPEGSYLKGLVIEVE